MTNREKYAQEFLDIFLSDPCATVAVDATGNNPTLCDCDDILCKNCLFYGAGNCWNTLVDWANEECKEDKENEKAIIDLVVCYLNAKTGRHYRPTNKITIRCIKARMNEGYKQQDFEKVIDTKVAEWMGTECEKYLAPETLFGNKFDKYLNQPMKKQTENKRSSKWGD